MRITFMAKKNIKKTVQFSKELFDTMMIEVMEGQRIRDICKGPDRPSIPRFYSWVGGDIELAKQYARARDVSADSFESDIIKLAENCTPETATADKAKFDMLRWIAGRRAPKRYSEKHMIEHTGENGGAIQEVRRVIVSGQDGESNT